MMRDSSESKDAADKAMLAATSIVGARSSVKKLEAWKDLYRLLSASFLLYHLQPSTARHEGCTFGTTSIKKQNTPKCEPVQGHGS